VYGEPTATALEPTTFPLGAASPHAVLNVIVQGVFEALPLDGAGRADFRRANNPGAILGEKRAGGEVPTLAFCHPFCTHRTLLCWGYFLTVAVRSDVIPQNRCEVPHKTRESFHMVTEHHLPSKVTMTGSN
jgi:hypothetical protein